MNKELKDRVFKIPDNVLEFLSNQKSPNGLTRNNTLLTAKQVTYGQLKKILHEMKYMDKIYDSNKYNSYGGDLMETWGWNILNSERKLIKSRKTSRKNADDIGGIGGERKNSFLSTHSKKNEVLPPINLVKSNSDKTSVSGLFEEINRIKTLMK